MVWDRKRRRLHDALARSRFRQPLDWWRTRQRRSKEVSELRALGAHAEVSVWFQQQRSMLLHELFDLYGSDKGSAEGISSYYPWGPHSYADVYSTLFDHCRHSVRTVFECGIGTNRVEFASNMSENGRPGASLRAWRDYFPNAEIIGADLDASILFHEDRIRTVQMDQTDPASIRRMWKQVGNPTVDFVVDDGLHSLEAAIRLLEGSWHVLRQGGIYVIEDVQVHQLTSYRRFVDELSAWATYVPSPRRAVKRFDDNCLVILRKGSAHFPGDQRGFRALI